MKNKTNKASVVKKVDVVSRFRQHIADAINDKNHLPEFNEEYLVGLFTQKDKLERERDKILKATLYSMFGLFIVFNGANFKFPGTQSGLQDIPNITNLLLVIASVAYAFVAHKLLECIGHDAVIDEVLY